MNTKYKMMRSIWTRNIHASLPHEDNRAPKSCVGKTYTVASSGNYPWAVGMSGKCLQVMGYRDAVRLDIDGIEYEFSLSQLSEIATEQSP